MLFCYQVENLNLCTTIKLSTWIINRGVDVAVNLQSTLIYLNEKILNQSINTNEMKQYLYLLKLWQAMLDVEKYKSKSDESIVII